jgi:hypothetical protein
MKLTGSKGSQVKSLMSLKANMMSVKSSDEA